MIAAPYAGLRDKYGKPIRKPLIPVPVYGLSDWNRRLVAHAKASA